MLTERHLQIFVALAEEQHFGDAARVVGITQPPLSQGLRRLEALIGAKLFERGSGGVELTPAGRALLPYARRALTSLEDLHQAARTRTPEGPEIRLGLTPETPPATAAALATACSTAAPNSRVTVITAPTTTLTTQVAAGRLTLAVVLHPTVLDGLDAGPVQLLPTWALMPTERPPTVGQPRGSVVGDAGRQPVGGEVVELGRLRGLPMAVRPRAEAPAARDLFLDTLALHRPGGGTVVVTDERAGLAMVAAGQAMLVTADPTLAAPGVDRFRLAGDPLPLRLRLVWAPGRVPFEHPERLL